MEHGLDISGLVLGFLGNHRRFSRFRRRACVRIRGAFENLDVSMLIVDDQGGATAANRASRNRHIVRFVILHAAEIGRDLSVLRSRVQLKAGFIWNINFNVTLPVLHLHAAKLAYAYFNRTICVLQVNIPRNTAQADVFRAGFKTQRSAHAVRLQFARVQVELAINFDKLQVGARGFEAYSFGNL